MHCGTGRKVSVLLAAGIVVSAAAGAATSEGQLQIVVTLADTAAEETSLEVALGLRSLPGDESTQDTPEEHLLELTAPGELATALPGGSWKVVARAAGYWAAEELVSVGEEPVRLEVELFPTGRVQGELEPGGGSEPPGSLRAAFGPVPGVEGRPAPVPNGETRCPVEEEGQFTCELPLGMLDLELRREGHAAVYRWGLEVSREGPVGLGPITFHPGGSVVGYVVVEGPLPAEEDAWVKLSPLTTGRATARARRRLDRQSRRAGLNARGFFQLRGLAAGTYRLEAGATGYTTASLAPIRVVGGKESTLKEPLRLKPPLSITVAVTPAADPDGRPWEITLFPEPDGAGMTREPYRGRVDEAGNWSRDAVRPGEYVVVIETSDALWHRAPVELLPSSDLLEVHLTLVEVDGSLTRDGEPVEASVVFGGKSADERVRLISDDEGEFEGVLPRDGRWPVSVVLDDQTLVLHPVSVVADERGEAELSLEIPSGRLSGVVVDSRGDPVAGAEVLVSRSAAAELDESETTTDEEGTFRFDGLVPDGYQIRARRPDPSSPLGSSGSTEFVEVEVEEDDEAEVRLVLHGKRPVRVRLVSSRGPVAGARYTVRPETESLLTPGPLDGGVTGPTGTFETHVPDNAVAITVLVIAPGAATAIQRHGVVQGREVTMFVPQLGGTLVLRGARWQARSPPLLFTEGTWMPLMLLRHRAQVRPLEDGRLEWRLPGMAPGGYRLCRGIRITSECDQGSLAVGGELVLEIP